MKIFLLIIGCLVLAIGVCLFFFYYRIIRKSNCYAGEICDVDSVATSYGHGASVHSIKVKLYDREEEIDVINSFFLTPFFEKRKVAHLRSRYAGRRIHVYYDPQKMQQALIKEYMWKIFLLPVLLVILGIVLVFAGINGYY